MNKDEFMQYLNENFDISAESFRLIDNILSFASNIPSTDEQYEFLCVMLDNTIGLSDNEIKKINL